MKEKLKSYIVRLADPGSSATINGQTISGRQEIEMQEGEELSTLKKQGVIQVVSEKAEEKLPTKPEKGVEPSQKP